VRNFNALERLTPQTGKGSDALSLAADERRNSLSLRVSESNALLNLIDCVRDQFPRRIRMSAFVLRDASQMSLSATQFFERAIHVGLGGKRNASTEAHCCSNDGDREHPVGVSVEKAHASFL
jgi:hypothetical protein